MWRLQQALQINQENGLEAACSPGNREEFVCFYTFLNVNQLVTDPNSDNIFLDLILSHFKNLSLRVANESILTCNLHHRAYTLEIAVEEIPTLKYQHTYYDYKNADFLAFNNFLTCIQWDQIFLDKTTLMYYAILSSFV